MNIAIVDDHLMIGQLLAARLEQSIAASHTEVFRNGMSFLDFNFSKWQPDLVIVDILMPMIGGLEMMEKAKPLVNPQCRFIILSTATDLSIVKDAMKKGAQGYVEKGASMNELLEAIETVMNGKQYISQSLKDDLLTFMLTDEPLASSLSPRENEVLQRICAGRTPKEIAFEMNLSLHTIQLYNKNLLRKFKLRRTAELVMFALTNGLCKPKQ